MTSKRLNLVTGLTGFSGSHVARDLLASGEMVVGTDLPAALEDQGQRDLLGVTGLDLDHPNLRCVPANLLQPESLDPLFAKPVTHIFHTASLYDYSAPLERLRRINVDGTKNLLDRTLDQKPPIQRFIHWSTCGIFGKPIAASGGPGVNLPFDEESSSPKTTPFGATGPEGTKLVNTYSVSKWEQEQMLWQAYEQRGLPLTVIRPAPIYGPGSSYGHGGIILTIAMGYVPAFPRDARNYITMSVHVEDQARFALFIADRDDAVGEDYNVVDNSIISYLEFLHYIGLLTGRSLREVPFIKQRWLRPGMVGAAKAWTWLEQRFGLPRIQVFEVQSATYVSSSYWVSNRKSLATGFEYKYPDVKEGLRDTVAWFRKMGWLTNRQRLLAPEAKGQKG